MKVSQDITVVIPAYNEAKTIGFVIDDVMTTLGEYIEQIIVVDDGSVDETARIAIEKNVNVLRHRYNQGYGASLKTGILATRSSLVLIMDADGQHAAKEALKLLNNFEGYDMVVGQRTKFLHSPLWRMPGKWLISWMARVLTKQHIPDFNSGLRLVRKDVIEKYVHLCPAGYSFSTTITMALHCRGYRVGYVPIDIKQRVGRGNVSIVTGLNTIVLVLRLATLFNPLRFFLPLSLGIGCIGLLWTIPYILAGRGISIGSMLAFSIAIILFALGLISDQISAMRLERYE